MPPVKKKSPARKKTATKKCGGVAAKKPAAKKPAAKKPAVKKPAASASKGPQTVYPPTTQADRDRCATHKDKSSDCRSDRCWYNYDNGDCVPLKRRDE